MSRTVSVSDAHENLAELLAAVERGEEIIITRRNKTIAKLTRPDEARKPFLEQGQFRSEIPPMKVSADQFTREMRDEERY